MDLLIVTEIPVEWTWKVFAGDIKVGDMPPDTPSLALPFSGLAFSYNS